VSVCRGRPPESGEAYGKPYSPSRYFRQRIFMSR
jgi:hypothetical protein